MSATLNPVLKTYVDATRDYFGAPSLALTVVKGEETVIETLGTVKVGGARITADTLFSIGGCSKAYIAAAAALVVGDGRLGWDDPVHDHLPEFVLPDPWITRNLSVRDLLGQRIGLAPTGHDGWDASASNLADARVFGTLAEGSRITGFRERHQPLPLAYAAVAEIVARVSGVPFATFIAERLFQPLGLDRTVWTDGWPNSPLETALPHRTDGGKLIAVEPPGTGESGVFTSAADSAVWMRLNLRRGFLGRQPIVPWSSMIDLHTPQILTEPDPRLGEVIAGYGMGWRITNYADARILHHEGHGPGTSAITLLMPHENLGVAVRIGLNCPPAVRAVTYRLMDAFLKRPETDWAPRFKAWADEDRAAAEANAS